MRSGEPSCKQVIRAIRVYNQARFVETAGYTLTILMRISWHVDLSRRFACGVWTDGNKMSNSSASSSAWYAYTSVFPGAEVSWSREAAFRLPSRSIEACIPHGAGGVRMENQAGTSRMNSDALGTRPASSSVVSMSAYRRGGKPPRSSYPLGPLPSPPLCLSIML